MDTPLYNKNFFKIGDNYYKKTAFKHLICLGVGNEQHVGVGNEQHLKYKIYFVFSSDLYNGHSSAEIFAASCDDKHSLELVMQMYIEALDRFLSDEEQ